MPTDQMKSPPIEIVTEKNTLRCRYFGPHGFRSSWFKDETELTKHAAGRFPNFTVEKRTEIKG